MYKYNAMVVKVVDGDTLDLVVDLGFDIFQKMRVRLFGIDTPEVYGVKHDSEEYARGKLSSDFVKKMLHPGAKVSMHSVKDKKGKYGRYLATVFCDVDGVLTNLNDLLVTNGLAIKKEY